MVIVEVDSLWPARYPRPVLPSRAHVKTTIAINRIDPDAPASSTISTAPACYSAERPSDYDNRPADRRRAPSRITLLPYAEFVKFERRRASSLDAAAALVQDAASSHVGRRPVQNPDAIAFRERAARPGA